MEDASCDALVRVRRPRHGDAGGALETPSVAEHAPVGGRIGNTSWAAMVCGQWMRNDEKVSLQALPTQGVSLVKIRFQGLALATRARAAVTRERQAPQYLPLQVFVPPTLSSRALISAGMSSTRGRVQET